MSSSIYSNKYFDFDRSARRGKWGRQHDQQTPVHRHTLERALGAQVTNRRNGTIKHRLLSKSESLFRLPHWKCTANGFPTTRRTEKMNETDAANVYCFSSVGRTFSCSLLPSVVSTEHTTTAAICKYLFHRRVFPSQYWPFQLLLTVFRSASTDSQFITFEFFVFRLLPSHYRRLSKQMLTRNSFCFEAFSHSVPDHHSFCFA